MIVEVKVDSEDTTVDMGVITDAVQEVIDLDSKEVEPPPKMGSGLDTDFIKGMGRKGEKFMILLDIDKVLSSESEAVLHDIGVLQDLGKPGMETGDEPHMV